MIGALFNQPGYLAAKKMLDATALRHEAIAANLANLETPNYRRIDLAPSFNANLQSAVAGGNAGAINQLQATIATDQTAVSSGRDGNTVQLESELVQLSQNTLAHSVETQLVSGELFRLRMAITGRSA
jgi:flagellar basal-body rod protein FlgB